MIMTNNLKTMEPTIKVLLVEDDPNFGSIMKSYLELNEYEVVLKTDGKQGLNAVQHDSFDICILDVMMPEMDGFTVAREIKKNHPDLPFIFLTAKSLKSDMLEGFKTGADDYVTKPFDSEVLLYKLKAILKRHLQTQDSGNTHPEFQIGQFTYNTLLRTLTRKGESQSLSPKEAQLLQMLCVAPERVLTRKEALTRIWGDDNYFNGRSMDVFIVRLRKYLKADPRVEIVNIHGNGFRLVTPDQ